MKSTSILLRFKPLLGTSFFRGLVVVFLLFTSKSVSQPLLGATYYSTEKAKGTRFVGTDILDNTFWLKGNTLVKTNRFNRTSNFQDFSLGQVKSVDVINPMRLGVFYKNYTTWVLLDENLVAINQFDFAKLLPLFDVSFVATSVNNTFWIVDELEKTVYRYDPKSKRINKLYAFVNTEIKEYYSGINHFYWITKENQLFGVDVYGSEVMQVAIPSYDRLQVVDAKTVLYSYKGELFYLDIENNAVSKIRIRQKSISNFFFNTQKLSIFDGRNLTIYHLKLS